MSNENSPLIPRLQLPQLGSPPASRPSAEPGTVLRPDTHHDNFLRFLDTGEGLDDLIAGVDRDTVRQDGCTDAQRDQAAEEARHKAAERNSAVPDPVISTRPRPGSFFDDDVEPTSDKDDQDGPEQPRQPSLDQLGNEEPSPARTFYAQNSSGEHSPEQALTTADVNDDDSAVLDDGDDDGGDDEDDPADEYDDDQGVPPAGSLWESTHGKHETPADFDSLIVDPEPDRAEPGPVAQWISAQHRRLWLPLGAAQKIAAVAVAGALTVWCGYLAFFSEDEQQGQTQPALAEPLVDTLSPPATATNVPLPPDSVVAPGCPARSQPPTNAFGPDTSKAWVCIRAFNTDLQTITITYSKPVVVTSIFVIPGFEFADHNGRNYWNEHRVVTKIQWQIGGEPYTQDIDPAAHTGATIQIPGKANRGVATQVIVGKIFQTVPPPPVEGENGPSGDDVNSTFAISKITVNGYPADQPPQ